ncbi:MAG: glycosyltransferase family 4 protein [Chloroflexi bacterium]|nr:glycosyltransferase family 4 protein [Chloroflexota bacterium]
MKIALLSAEYPPCPGGVGDYTRHLGMALAQRGHQVIVLTGTPGTVADGGTPRVFRLALDRWNFRCWGAVRRALADLRPDVLHIQYQTGAYGMHPAINFLPGRLRMRADRPRIVVTAHDLLPPYLFPKAGPLRDRVTRRLMIDADATVATNEEDAAQLCRWGVAEAHRAPEVIPIGANIGVAPPPGYERGAWRRHLGIAPDETLIAYFGLISRSKGLDTLVQALAHLPDTFRLLIIGGEATAPSDRAYAAEIRRRIAADDLTRRVIVTGHCHEADVSAHLLAADMAALPFADGASFRRGSLLAVLTHGIPTVTTRGAAALRDEEHALITPPGDATALAGAIVRLANDMMLRSRLGEAGRALAAPFSWPAIAARHEQLYRALLSAEETIGSRR